MGTLDETVEHLKEPDLLAQFSSQEESKQLNLPEASLPERNVRELKNNRPKDVSVKVNHVHTEDLQCQKIHSMCITAKGTFSLNLVTTKSAMYLQNPFEFTFYFLSGEFAILCEICSKVLIRTYQRINIATSDNKTKISRMNSTG